MTASPKTPPPKTVKAYLDSLPADRKKVLVALRKVVRAHLNPGFKEGIQYGHMAYFVPHSVYPDGYHCSPEQPLPFMSIASQKSYISIHLFCLYVVPKEEVIFRKQWLATGKKLNMGKACVRVKKLEDVPLEVLGKAIARITVKKFLAAYEAGKPAAKKKPAAVEKKSAGKKAKASKKN